MNDKHNYTKFGNKNKEKEKINRKCSNCEEEDYDDKEKPIQISRKSNAYNNQNIEISNEIDNKIKNVINSSGKPVDSSTKEFMKSRFGYDFSRVKIYDDSKAVELTTSVNAYAFTTGNSIFMGKNESVLDKKLIAHELTHVIQQSRSGKNLIQRKPRRKHYKGRKVVTVNWTEDEWEFRERVIRAISKKIQLHPDRFNVGSATG